MSVEGGVVPSASDRFSTPEAADYIGCSAGYLKKLRGTGDGPRYERFGKRKGIIYMRADVDAWRAERSFGSTSEYPESFR